MKRLSILLILLIACLNIHAVDTIPQQIDKQELDSVLPRPNILKEMSGVEVISDSMVSLLLENAISGSQELIEIDGYRVQIYSSNQQQTAKVEALNLETQIKESVSYTIYVQYSPPFWKVRIGDFRTYEEAREYKKEFVLLFPELMGETYIVRDKIKVLP